jgi:hypothetical protein
VEKYGTARQATNDNVMRSVRFAFWVIKTRIQTHTQNIYCLLLFHGSNGLENAPQRYVNVHFFCFSDISFKCSFISIGKEGSCTEDLIDQDAGLTVVIATVRKIQVFFNTTEHCDCCKYHISKNDILQFFHTSRS